MGKMIEFEGELFQSIEGETVLDCLLRHGKTIRNSCRSGICHSCLLKSPFEELGPISQKGLNQVKRESGLFLSCQQKADIDLKVFRPNESGLITAGVILSQEWASDSVVIVRVRPKTSIGFKAGQFVNLIRKDGVCRPYSIASKTGDRDLEFHIRKTPGGAISSWFYDEDLVGEEIDLSGPLGECYLSETMQDKRILLVGVGTGLAPLYGVLQDWMSTKWDKQVTLVHGGRSVESLYFVDRLKNLERENSFLRYRPIYLEGEKKSGFVKGDICDYIQNLEYGPEDTVVMICGDHQLVKKLKQQVFLAGVPSKNIFSDPFVTQSAK